MLFRSPVSKYQKKIKFTPPLPPVGQGQPNSAHQTSSMEWEDHPGATNCLGLNPIQENGFGSDMRRETLRRRKRDPFFQQVSKAMKETTTKGIGQQQERR